MSENKVIAHEMNQEMTEDVRIHQNVDFKSMLLSQKIMDGLHLCGYRKPSPIQLSAIPLGRCGFDIIVQSKSGTGKTLVFSIIALEVIDTSTEHLQALVLAPTREIAVQITDVLKSIGQKCVNLNVATFIGGLPEAEDVARAKNCHIAVGAPGRVKSLMKKGILNFENVKLFVMDEVDKLFEKSFQKDITDIYTNLPVKKQVIAASATFTSELKAFLSNFMHSPTEISAESETPLLLGLKQFIKKTESSSNVVMEIKHKNGELMKILTHISFTQCLIFSNYQTRAEAISSSINREGLNSKFISAAQNQIKRLEVLDDLKQFKCRVLISTDLTARGIDAANVDLIINYDVPVDVQTYLHRMGRAGRFGSKGICITLISNEKELNILRKYLGCIGGETLSISKLCEITNGMDLWQTEFEQIHGIVGDDVESLSKIKTEIDVMKSVDKQKKSSKKKKEKVMNNTIEELSCLDLNKSEENAEIEKKRKRNLETNTNLNAELTLQQMASGNFELDQSQCNESDETKKRKIVNDNKNEIYIKNVAKYEVAKILSDAENYNENNMKSYLEVCGNSQKRGGEEQRLVCGENPDENLDKIFVRAYEFMLNLNRGHWKSYLPETELEMFEKKNDDEEKESEWEDEENGDDEEDEEYDENYQAEGMNYDENGKRIYDYVEIPNRMVWLPVEESVLESKRDENKVNLLEPEENEAMMIQNVSQSFNQQQQIIYSENRQCDLGQFRSEHFTQCFQECSNRLWEEGCNFNSVQDFDTWFYNWQHEVHKVREYVRQNLYVKEMSEHQ